jgi:hypothetical protein
MMDVPSKQREFEELKARVVQLERELEEAPLPAWQPRGYYAVYSASAGALLGMFGAATALLVNIIGAPLAGKYPLEIIRVYLTFPLGETALLLNDPARAAFKTNDGMILVFGCCLYLATGMLLGMPLHMALVRFAGTSTALARVGLASLLSLALWLVNFYLVLSWLQPLLFGGNWITDPRYLPWWVAAATHLVFGWTMALLYPLGRFIPDSIPLAHRPAGQQSTEKS